MSGNGKEITYSEAIEKVVIDEGLKIYGASLLKTIKSMITENDFIKPIVGISQEINKKKVEMFIDNISHENIIEYMDNLQKDEDKVFFAESVKKAIDLNDNFQIYVLAKLCESFTTNHKLNYFETQLYYNLSSFSEIDFLIFWGICKITIEIKNKRYKLSGSAEEYSLKVFMLDGYRAFLQIRPDYENIEIIKIALNRFSNIGILSYTTQTGKEDYGSIVDEVNFKTIERYEMTSYAEILFGYLHEYCIANDINCDELLKIQK